MALKPIIYNLTKLLSPVVPFLPPLILQFYNDKHSKNAQAAKEILPEAIFECRRGKMLPIKNAAEPTIVDLWLWRTQLFLILVIQFG